MKKFTTLFVTLVVLLTNANAWEINTHRAIEQEASKNAVNFSKFMENSGIKRQNYLDEKFEGYYNPETHEEYTYTGYALNGEENGISADKWHQSFSSTFIGAKDLLEAGAILEDAQWPHGWEVGGGVSGEWWEPGTWVDAADRAHGRFLNHFYNVQGICKSLKCATTDAITWAYDSQKNAYDYQSAMDYFSRGFSETKPRIRRKYQAKMLVAVGHMMHMMNDMNVPAHTRDDGHNPDPLEWWMRRDIVLA